MTDPVITKTDAVTVITALKGKTKLSITASDAPKDFLPRELTVTDTEGKSHTLTDFTLKSENFDSRKAGTYFFALSVGEENMTLEKELGIRVTVVHGSPVSVTIPETEIAMVFGYSPILPETVYAKDDCGNRFNVKVTWQCGDFRADEAGVYTYTGKLSAYPSFPVPAVKVTVKERVPYVAPEGYYQPVYETKTLTGGDYILQKGILGLKVWRLQRTLNVAKRTCRFDSATEKAVNAYRASLGLEQNGIVDEELWYSLGLSEYEWKYFDTYYTPVAITKEDSRDQIMQVFMDTARSYLGTPYVVGASARPGQGCDCSGLVMQCLSAIGIYPDIISPVQHVNYEYDSYYLWMDPKFEEIDKSELREGDLIFWHKIGDRKRPINHVAINLDGVRCIEAWNATEIGQIDKTNIKYEIVGYKRVIAMN